MKGVHIMDVISWEEMVKRYPDQWVAVKNATMDGADIISGEVVVAKNDRDMRKFRVKNRKTGLVFRRTSEGAFDGFINSDIKITVN